MQTATPLSLLRPDRGTFQLLLKWCVVLLIPLFIFMFAWSGEAIANNVVLGIVAAQMTDYSLSTVIQAAIFCIVLFGSLMGLAGYLVAADNGTRSLWAIWLDSLIFVIVPLVLIIALGDLLFGFTIAVLVWAVFLVLKKRLLKPVYASAAILPPLLNDTQKKELQGRAIAGGFWFATIFALISLIVDIVFFVSGSLPVILLVWAIVRTILLPILGYFLGQLGGTVALRQTRSSSSAVVAVGAKKPIDEEIKDLIPSAQPIRGKGAQRFYVVALLAFVIFYPILDPLLFSFGTNGRLTGYGDAGYYVILALGLNIVVGFAGLLDLGYVAFFAIGSYTWAMIGSTQFTALTGIMVHPEFWSALFWPMLFVGAVIAALWGVILGVPTLRLRGDYLAIVTLGFGEIIPIIFQEMDKYTNGVNGIPGVMSPSFFGITWSSFTPIPYYYLILALIALLIFVNVRLRDSRLGRAWVAIREDEIAAASSGINLVNTKLFAFGAGAFFSGVAGVYHSAKLGIISPDAFSAQDSIIYLAMVVIGGLGSIPGVIVGAFVVYAINLFILAQLDSMASDPGNIMHAVLLGIKQLLPGFTFGNIHNLVFGIILVVVMLYRPEGLIPSLRRKRELHRSESDLPEEGALDVPPGAPGFETTVRVE